MLRTMSAPPSGAVPSGIQGLDEILGGGFPRNRLFLVQGDPGAGKTTLALQFLRAGAARGERGLYVTLSESAPELQAVAASHGWDLTGVEIFDQMTELSLDREDENTLFHPAEIELAEAIKRLRNEIDRLRPERVVIDSLSELRLLSQSPLRYRREILALKRYFSMRDATVLLIDDRTAQLGDEQLQSIAHGVLSMDQLMPLYGGARRRMRLIKVRGVALRGGFHDFVMETGGIRVFPRLIAADHPGTVPSEPVSSGVPSLDALLGGGLDGGTSVLLMGPPGSGKSLIGAQYALSAARAGKAATIFAFDESRATLIARNEGLGIDFRGHAAEVEIVQIDPAEMPPGEFTARVRDKVEQGCRLVMIDSLNGYLHAMPDEQFLILQLHELLTYLGQQGVLTILIVAQHGSLGPEVESPVDVSYLADSVVVLRHFESAGRIRIAVSVLKRRTGGHERSIRELTIGPVGITVGDPLVEFDAVLTGTPRYTGRPEALDRAADRR